jgi:hypothetical protein
VNEIDVIAPLKGPNIHPCCVLNGFDLSRRQLPSADYASVRCDPSPANSQTTLHRVARNERSHAAQVTVTASEGAVEEYRRAA